MKVIVPKNGHTPIGIDALIDPKNGTYYSVGQGLVPAETAAARRGG